MKKQFDILDITRKNILSLIEKLSDEQLIMIPEKFNNNILWNAGHVLNSQQKLCYALTGNPIYVPEIYSTLFSKGTSPRDWKKTPQIEEMKRWMIETARYLREDYKKGIFENFQEYKTSFGYELKSIEDVICFNNVHEGLHLGVMMALRKLVNIDH
jgi:hypothetical protein